jgi:guanylate kinase
MAKSNVFILSGPSGAGKDSIIEGLKKIIPLQHIITTVSRPMRPGEKQGKPYFFITEKEFLEKLKRDEFFEHDKHFGNYYGLTWEEVNKIKTSNRICFWQAEYKGVKTAKEKLPNIVTIFINSPLDDLIRRMDQREEKIDKKIYKERVDNIKEWLKHLDIYDFIVDNKEGKLNDTIKEVAKIIKDNLR